MTRSGYRAAALLSLLFVALMSPLSAAAHDRLRKVDAKQHEGPSRRVDARLYEVTENMSLDDLGAPTTRTATAALQGTAQLGSPLCPAELVNLLARAPKDGGLGLLTSADKPCTITAIGSDEVDLATGAGSLEGGFAVVINLDNITDAPEFVVMTGQFKGNMQVLVDMSANPPTQLPLIALTDGTFEPQFVLGEKIQPGVPIFGLDPATFAPASFSGVFRLPFALDRRGKRMRPHPTRDAFYLGDRGQLIKVKPEEWSLGFPTVLVEIEF